MADIFFKCPECEGQLVVDDRGVGLHLPCPFCSKPVTIPRDTAENGAANVNGAPLERSKEESSSPPTAVPVPMSADTHPNTAVAATNPNDRPEIGVGGEPEDPTADLEWDEEVPRDTVEAGKVENKEEIRRLAAMMNPDDLGLAAAAHQESRGPLSFRCPSCGQILATKRANPGDHVRCKECESEFTVPEPNQNTIEPRGLGTPRPSRGELPSGRNRLLRTADDIRKDQEAHQAMVKGVPAAKKAPGPAPSPAQAPAPGKSLDAESVLTPEVQAMLLKELQRLQAAQSGTAPANSSPARQTPEPAPPAPPPKIRRRPLPPLAQHGEVVPVSPSPVADSTVSNPAPPTQEPRRERVRPNQEALPPLVTMDTMDLDSEVARQWGEAAVVPTKTLNWVAWVVILWALGIGGYFGYHFFNDWKAKQEALAQEAELQSQPQLPSEQELVAQENEGIVKALIGFHDAATAEEKAAFVRNAESVLPLMQVYYKHNDPEPRRIKQDVITLEPNTFGNRLFRTVFGEYEEGGAQINPDRKFLDFEANFEATPGGSFLLDWPSWVGHNEIPLDSFTKQGMTTPQVFRLWVEETAYPYRLPSADDASNYTGYLLKDKREIDRLYGYAEKGTPASERLMTLFTELKKSERKPTVRLMLSLRFAPDADTTKGQVLIDEFIQEDWVETEEAP